MGFLFNNAGIVERSNATSVLTSSLADWKNVLNVNVLGVVHVLQQFVPAMQAQATDCVLVNTSSYAGLLNGSRVGFGSGLPYSASKHAVTILSENLAHELRSNSANQISMHLLCPAGVATNIVENAADAAVQGLSDAAAKRAALMKNAAPTKKIGITSQEMIEVLYQGVQAGTFYVLGYDNSRGGSKEGLKALIRVRADDILEERPPFSYLHPDKQVRAPARAVLKAAAASQRKCRL